MLIHIFTGFLDIATDKTIAKVFFLHIDAHGLKYKFFLGKNRLRAI